jgi:hypothetical protein
MVFPSYFCKSTTCISYSFSTKHYYYEDKSSDIFLPKTIQESKQRLDQMVALINTQTNNIRNIIQNFNQIRALF